MVRRRHFVSFALSARAGLGNWNTCACVTRRAISAAHAVVDFLSLRARGAALRGEMDMDDRRFLQAARAPMLRGRFPGARPHLLGLLLTAAVAGVMLAAPRPVAMPVLALAGMGLAGSLALAAFATRASQDRTSVTLWDAAGACAFIGCAAAMLSRPESLVRLFADAGAP
jgi:hypothetical protein